MTDGATDDNTDDKTVEPPTRTALTHAGARPNLESRDRRQTLLPAAPAHISVHSYTFRLNEVVAGGRAVHERTGFWITKVDDDVVPLHAVAEVAPLAPLSSERFTDVTQLRTALNHANESAAPSLSFAVALLDGALGNIALPRQPRHVPTAKLVGDRAGVDHREHGHENVGATQIPPTESRHPSTTKLKVGRFGFEHDTEAVTRHATRTTGRRLRLDGNRVLSKNDALALAARCADTLDFFEEPCPTTELQSLTAAERKALRVALDETLVEATRSIEPHAPQRSVANVLDHLLKHEATAWVLKPSLLGAHRTSLLIECARAHGIDVVISSLYESAVGRFGLARLASALTWQAAALAHGIGTGPAFVDDAVVIDDMLHVRASLTARSSPSTRTSTRGDPR